MSEITTTDEKGRALIVKELSLSEQMDLAEAAGDAGEVHRWWLYAFSAAAVRSIGGVPVVFPKDKDGVKKMVDNVGVAGMVAATKAINEAEASEAKINEAVAKN